MDFSDLPPLALAHSAGAALDTRVGELPLDILDRGSDGSDTEPVRVENGDSDRDVDVETVEGKDDGADPDGRDSDRRLLATVLSDLSRISAPHGASFPFEPSCSPESRKQRFRTPCERKRPSAAPHHEPPARPLPAGLGGADSPLPSFPVHFAHFADADSSLGLGSNRAVSSRTIPPITALKRHFTVGKELGSAPGPLRCPPASDSFLPATLHSSHESTNQNPPPSPSSYDSRPASPSDLHWSPEQPAPSDSGGRAGRDSPDTSPADVARPGSHADAEKQNHSDGVGSAPLTGHTLPFPSPDSSESNHRNHVGSASPTDVCSAHSLPFGPRPPRNSVKDLKLHRKHHAAVGERWDGRPELGRAGDEPGS